MVGSNTTANTSNKFLTPNLNLHESCALREITFTEVRDIIRKIKNTNQSIQNSLYPDVL